MKAWFRTGAPWIWLNAGAIALCLVMVIGVLGLILVQGAAHFWPADLHTVQAKQSDGSMKRLLAEQVRAEDVSAAVLRDSGVKLESNELVYQRQLLKLGNRDVYGRDFAWFLSHDLSDRQEPLDATVIERREWGNFYGFPVKLLEGDKVVAEGCPTLARAGRANRTFK